MVIKFNFSSGAKISWRLVQKWPRNKRKIAKPPKMDPKTFFSQKGPRVLNFWNKFLNPHINRLLWLEPIYWDIYFVLNCLPALCEIGAKINEIWACACIVYITIYYFCRFMSRFLDIANASSTPHLPKNLILMILLFYRTFYLV